MTESELVQDCIKSQRESKQKLIDEHKKRISRGEELDFVCFELYKELQEENERLKKDFEENQNLATIAYMDGMSENKAKLDEAKGIIKEFCSMTLIFVPPEDKEKYTRLFDKAEAFLKEQKMKFEELEKKANSSWEKDNAVSIETDNEDAYKAGYIAGAKEDAELDEAKELLKELNEGLDKLYLGGLSDKQIALVEKLQAKAEAFLKECGE